MGVSQSSRDFFNGDFDKLHLDLNSHSDQVMHSVVLILQAKYDDGIDFIDGILAKGGSPDHICRLLIAKLPILFFTTGALYTTALPRGIAEHFKLMKEKAALAERATGEWAEAFERSVRMICMDRDSQTKSLDKLLECHQSLRLFLEEQNVFVPLLKIFSALLSYKIFTVTHKGEFIYHSFRVAVSLHKYIPHSKILTPWSFDVKHAYNLFEFQRLTLSMREYTEELDRLVDSESAPVTLADLPKLFIGQQGVIDRVTDILRQRENKLLPSDQPLVLWFSGSSGSGKTYLAQLIAECVHKQTDPHRHGKLCVLSCQNLRTAESVNSLVDPPTGIKGHAPLLTTLEACPECVIVLDELDKAHADSVENIFLPAFQRGGFLKSNKDGRTVDTTRAIFIITSNIGQDSVTDDDKVRRELAGKFSTPFLNRSTTHFFVFRPCSEAERLQATHLELTRWAAGLRARAGLTVRWVEGVPREIGESFTQFHGQDITSRCAGALNVVMENGSQHQKSRFYLFHNDHNGIGVSTFEETAVGFSNSRGLDDAWIYEKFQKESGLQVNDLAIMVQAILRQVENKTLGVASPSSPVVPSSNASSSTSSPAPVAPAPPRVEQAPVPFPQPQSATTPPQARSTRTEYEREVEPEHLRKLLDEVKSELQKEIAELRQLQITSTKDVNVDNKRNFFSDLFDEIEHYNESERNLMLANTRALATVMKSKKLNTNALRLLTLSNEWLIIAAFLIAAALLPSVFLAYAASKYALYYFAIVAVSAILLYTLGWDGMVALTIAAIRRLGMLGTGAVVLVIGVLWAQL